MKTFSDRLKFLRGTRSQAEFARMLGIPSQQTYANYETGRVPKTPLLQRIADTMHVSVQWLLTGENPPSKHDVPTVMLEQAAAYGVPFETNTIAPIESLSTEVLIDLLVDMPRHIATTSNQTVRERFATEAETAAKELKQRLNL